MHQAKLLWVVPALAATLVGCEHTDELFLDASNAAHCRDEGSCSHSTVVDAGEVDVVDSGAGEAEQVDAVPPGTSSQQGAQDSGWNSGVDGATDSAASPPVVVRPIEELARGRFIDSVPVWVEDHYGQADVAILKEMVSDPENDPHHELIVTLIGLISNGTTEDVDWLIDYFNARPDSGRTRTIDGELVTVATALGYLISRTASEEALTFLLEKLAELDSDACIASTYGLAVSGSMLALTAMETLVEQPEGAALAVYLRGAIETNRKIAQVGLRRFYDDIQ